ncbi:MAG: chemotaxis response regulator protein-glutamate methylesterase [Proteobacteria bacterium]|nr:chemotaxis response regulator protein-glutamate methylesterase [Desulfobulbaceae bacterium]MBU4154317.1 chemotaxis response regulator protein-glutamate methylesterase [Pseudomonadota bacterium]MDP2106961.1 chemotaxis response regulator protein-glutamate methylesterase [Desulfobulbaceae bacterium]
MPIKVLVVDDTIFYRTVVCDILKTFPNVEVVGSANNGAIALSRIKTLKPDLITLDVEMPVMNGLQLMVAINEQGLDVDCLMLSSKTEKGSAITMQALTLGAFDFITKPDASTPADNIRELTTHLRKFISIFEQRLILKRKMGTKGMVKKSGAALAALQTKEILAVSTRAANRTEKSQAVAIGISTGGPNALNILLPKLPAHIGVPIFLVQHMPPMFTASLAKCLDDKCQLKVKEAENGETVVANTVYIAPGGKQMKVASSVGLDKIIRITDDPPENNCKPAVDYLFRSAAREYGSKLTCVVMTGMGSDGQIGMTVAKASGALTIAQDEASCVVYGMPKAVIDAGVADVVAPLDSIDRAIIRTL